MRTSIAAGHVERLRGRLDALARRAKEAATEAVGAAVGAAVADALAAGLVGLPQAPRPPELDRDGFRGDPDREPAGWAPNEHARWADDRLGDTDQRPAEHHVPTPHRPAGRWQSTVAAGCAALAWGFRQAEPSLPPWAVVGLGLAAAVGASVVQAVADSLLGVLTVTTWLRIAAGVGG